ncbi:MAG: tRNA (adenosine(37)-N6)-threonylcarbamoyltransferase complex ATPase subunit type 1 TsaE [Mariprofundales bacterium]|nr:tRNA (adenosine(37)-N6)-threonylcarbamoyltransferase complex ATPase subunit type 1 TsaE [Mariprofundales bacterium]
MVPPCRVLEDEQATIDAAQLLATDIRAGDCVAISGDLGAGKSVFARALMRALGVQDSVMPSPTYAIVQPYQGREFPVAHMDWYRIDSGDALLHIGIDEYLQPPWVSIVEWPQRAPALLPSTTHHITVIIDPNDPATARQIAVTHPTR